MPDRLFDDLKRSLAEPATQRRRLLAGLVATAAVTLGGLVGPVAAGKRRRGEGGERTRRQFRFATTGN